MANTITFNYMNVIAKGVIDKEGNIEPHKETNFQYFTYKFFL